MTTIYIKKEDGWKAIPTNVQSDWDATSGEAVILNKPTALSEFENDEAFQTQTEVSTAISGAISTHDADTEAHGDIRDKFADYVPTTRKINNKALTSDVTLSLGDVADTASRMAVSPTEKATWNAKQDALTFDNTPAEDSENPVKSGGIYDALALKADASALSTHTSNTNNPHSVTKAQVGLPNVVDGAQPNVVEGASIGGTDLTITEKKVIIPVASTANAGVVKVGDNLTIASDGTLSAVAQAQVQANWTETTTTSPAFIKNKPTLGTAAALDVATTGDAAAGQVVKGNDSRLTDQRDPNAHANSHVGSGADRIPDASGTTGGLMTSGQFVKLNSIEEGAQKNVQSNWTQTSTTADDYIKNKPTAVSAFTNDADYQSASDVEASIAAHDGSEEAHADIRADISSEVSRAEGVEEELQEQIDALEAKTDVVDVVSCYDRGADTTKTDIVHYDTTKLSDNDIVKVLDDETHNHAISYFRWAKPETGSNTWAYVGSSGPYYTKSEADSYFVPQQRTVNGYALSGNITLDADDVNALPDDTKLSDLEGDATHRLVTDAEKAVWNAKMDAMDVDDTPTTNSENLVTSGGVKAYVDTEAAKKVDKVEGKGLSTKDFTAAYETKLNGIEAGAEVNVQPDWTQTTTTHDGYIANKPFQTIGGGLEVTSGALKLKGVSAYSGNTTPQASMGATGDIYILFTED